MRRRRFTVAGDERGVSAIEFGLLAPVLMMALMGVFDTAYDMYMGALLDGAIQDAARDSTLEKASLNTASIDAQVTKVIQDIAPNATLTFSRKSYRSFSATGKPEDFTDTNKNKKCDANEPYEDFNDNSRWDTDQGQTGMGGARDVVRYTVAVTYPRPFGVAGFLGLPSTYTMTSDAALANQPWDNITKVATVRNCK